jgi:photosystem II stability/assembly factor-like uncharacterized protein
MLSSVIPQTSNDVYSIAIDPNDPQHVLAAFHSPWNGNGAAGIVESKNGGQSWNIIPPGDPGWGHGHYIMFISSTTWLLGTQEDGFWRTTNSGQSWTQVTAHNMQHGGTQLYRAANGVLYVGAQGQILRSTDDGQSWNEVGPNAGADGYYAIMGDGTTMWAQSANTGGNTSDPDPPYYSSPESDGVNWSPYNANLTFPDNGPMSMVFDSVNGIIYSSNWLAGVWRLKA